MRSHPVALLMSFAGAALAAGCYTADIAGQSSFNGCSPSPVIVAGQGISDFRQRIARQIAVAPADSVLDVVVTFTTAVVQADRDRITSYGGNNVSTAGNASSLKVEFVAADLARYVSDDTGRLSDVVIYDPACTTE
jgi:hypothetical protein